MAGEDAEYTAWIRGRPCCAPGCGTRQGVQAHHATNGLLLPPGVPMPPKMVSKRKGRGQKPHDYYTMPLCLKHHIPGVHERGGPFKKMPKQRLDAWQMEQVTYHRFLWDEQQGTQEWLDGLPF